MFPSAEECLWISKYNTNYILILNDNSIIEQVLLSLANQLKSANSRMLLYVTSLSVSLYLTLRMSACLTPYVYLHIVLNFMWNLCI